MAKIGNEAVLILKLANARMLALEEQILTAAKNERAAAEKEGINLVGRYSADWISGWNRASREWWETIVSIKSELERS